MSLNFLEKPYQHCPEQNKLCQVLHTALRLKVTKHTNVEDAMEGSHTKARNDANFYKPTRILIKFRLRIYGTIFDIQT